MKKVLSNFLILLSILMPSLAFADFSDVNEQYYFYEAIEYAENEGIVQGYPDNTFKPYDSINRAEFTKIISESVFFDEEIADCDVNVMDFSDVPKDAWFAKYICVAEENDIISGYMDGRFGPEDNIKFVQAAKILTLSFRFTPEERDDQMFWYEPYLEILIEEKAIPITILSISSYIKRDEMVEMIYRLLEGNNGKDYMVLYYSYLYPFSPDAVDLGFGFFKDEGIYNARHLVNTSKALLVGEDLVEAEDGMSYFEVDAIPDFDVDTFEALSPGYGKDKDDAYYFDVHEDYLDEIKTIDTADITSFDAFNNVYAKDKGFVYFEGEVLEGADPESFKLADMQLAEFDEQNGIDDGDLDRTRLLMFNYQRSSLAYAMDKNAVYYADQIMEGVDMDTFIAYAFDQYLEDKYPIYAKDQDSVYYKGEELSIDAETFEIISWQYQKDSEYIYFNDKIIEEADVDTFEVIDAWEYAKDKDHVFFQDEILTGEDPDTFVVK